MHGNAARPLLLILAVLSTALLGLAIWTSGGTMSTQPSGTLSSPTVPTVAAVR